ncbi:MAG TPA: GlsB/YeaQ/YmgE family stress response membrane protein [Ktedonosporobacter sp.]|nr:GlsB/YeaQ/YmgE family stress response membrane protein [Ktedonosporobacter sp.]
MTFATLLLGATLDPGGLLMWLIVGLVAGFLASRVMRGGGYGLVGDIVVGIIGAFLGGWLAGFLGFGGTYGLVGSIVIAFIGACILIALLHAVSGGMRGRRA